MNAARGKPLACHAAATALVPKGPACIAILRLFTLPCLIDTAIFATLVNRSLETTLIYLFYRRGVGPIRIRRSDLELLDWHFCSDTADFVDITYNVVWDPDTFTYAKIQHNIRHGFRQQRAANACPVKSAPLLKRGKGHPNS